MAKTEWQKAADIVLASGGTVVGRTKLQKIAYLMEIVGYGTGFQFSYRHFGPYSEALAGAIQTAVAFGLVTEDERKATWGGTYSIFKTADGSAPGNTDAEHFAQQAAHIDSVQLELAATAAYLSLEGYPDPWKETARRKPDKAAEGKLEEAQGAYRKLSTDWPLPRI